MTTESATTRREFLLEAAMSSLALSALASDVLASQQPGTATGLPTRVLGRTGERVSISPWVGGTSARCRIRAEAIRIMHAAIDEGLTFFDNAWDYHDGGTEEMMGRPSPAVGATRCS